MAVPQNGMAICYICSNVKEFFNSPQSECSKRFLGTFNSVGVQAPTELNAPRGCARIRTGICLQ